MPQKADPAYFLYTFTNLPPKIEIIFKTLYFISANLKNGIKIIQLSRFSM
jgi:hypothetical protein